MELLPKLRSPETITQSSHVWKGYKLVHLAARNGWEDVCKLLVEKYNCEPTTVDDTGMSPLHFACQCGDEASVEYLLSLPSVLRGIRAKDTRGYTPLHLACRMSNFAVVEILLETDSAIITEQDKYGRTPFEILLRYGYGVLSRIASKIDWSIQLQVKSFFNVFLVGNSGAGKSTLAAALLELTRYTPTQHGRITKVEELTAGVVPTQCKG